MQLLPLSLTNSSAYKHTTTNIHHRIVARSTSHITKAHLRTLDPRKIHLTAQSKMAHSHSCTMGGLKGRFVCLSWRKAHDAHCRCCYWCASQCTVPVPRATIAMSQCLFVYAYAWTNTHGIQSKAYLIANADPPYHVWINIPAISPWSVVGIVIVGVVGVGDRRKWKVASDARCIFLHCSSLSYVSNKESNLPWAIGNTGTLEFTSAADLAKTVDLATIPDGVTCHGTDSIFPNVFAASSSNIQMRRTLQLLNFVRPRDACLVSS